MLKAFSSENRSLLRSFPKKSDFVKTEHNNNGKFVALLDVESPPLEQYPPHFRIALFENSDFQIFIENGDFDVELSNDLHFLPQKFLDESHSHYIVSTMIGKHNVVKNFQDFHLSSDSRKLLNCDNAGGDSVESEVLSLEFFKRCWNAELKESEMEIEYNPIGSKKTDYSILLNINNIINNNNKKKKKKKKKKNASCCCLGVSVTRAFAFEGNFRKNHAERLLQKKLKGIIESSRNVTTKSKWTKQILHIFTPSFENERILKEVYDEIDEDIKGDTVVVVTVTLKTLPFIYSKNWKSSKNLN